LGGDEGEIFLPLRLFYAAGRPGQTGQPGLRPERQAAGGGSGHRERGEGRDRPSPQRRPRGLSRAGIVAAAIAIADAEGTEAVSMRRIARDLQVGAMSLYWYVESREELHQLMVESVQGEIEAPAPSGDWRADLRAYAGNARAAMLRHPWTVDFFGSGPPSGPNNARNAERLLAALDGHGLDTVTAMWVLMTLSTYVLGAVQREIQEQRWQLAVTAAAGDEAAAAELAGLQAEFGRRIGWGLRPVTVPAAASRGRH
jgi:AcrR family transcriptional regulator